MTTTTKHVVKASNLKQNDTVEILFQPHTIINLTPTPQGVFVCAEMTDDLGTVLAEVCYLPDERVIVHMPAEA